ncbi:hypothetical protein K438DRAFT_1983197 [Mycena galopus ATCC 62051]|nr:hypothetical protein K438DRAFT_1983197 [Mycena galopus ATCC 62051]
MTRATYLPSHASPPNLTAQNTDIAKVHAARLSSSDPPVSIHKLEGAYFGFGFCLRLRMARIAMNSWCSACAYDTPSRRYASAAPLLRCCDSSVFAAVTIVTSPIYSGSRHIYRTGGALLLNGCIATPAQRPAAAIPAGRKPQRLLLIGVCCARCHRIRRLPPDRILTWSNIPEPDADFHLAQCSLSRAQFWLPVRAPSLLLLAALLPRDMLLPSYLASSLHLIPSHPSREALQRHKPLLRDVVMIAFVLVPLRALVFNRPWCISYPIASDSCVEVPATKTVRMRRGAPIIRSLFPPIFLNLKLVRKWHRIILLFFWVNNRFIHLISLLCLHAPLDSVVHGALASRWSSPAHNSFLGRTAFRLLLAIPPGSPQQTCPTCTP